MIQIKTHIYGASNWVLDIEWQVILLARPILMWHSDLAQEEAVAELNPNLLQSTGARSHISILMAFMHVMGPGDRTSFFRPCIDCGKITSSFCNCCNAIMRMPRRIRLLVKGLLSASHVSAVLTNAICVEACCGVNPPPTQVAFDKGHWGWKHHL